MNGSRAKNAKTVLKQGANHLRLEYFQSDRKQGITFGWKNKSMDGWEWPTATPASAKAGP